MLLVHPAIQQPMSTKRNRVRRHSISSLEEAAKKVSKEPANERAESTMPISQQNDQTLRSARKRPLPIDAAAAAALANDLSPAKKVALLAGGLTMEDLLKSAPVHATGGEHYLCLPGGKAEP